MRTYKSLAAASLALVLLAACGSSGLGDILGGGGSTSGASNYEIRGTVDSVDPNSRSIYLTNVSGYTSMLSNSGGSAVRVYYDDRTPVSHQGSTYRPEDLERGDQISVRVDEDGNRLLASTMTVISDVSNGSSYPASGSGVYGSNVRGTIRYIDTSRRTIEVDTGSVNPVIVEFDTSTPVYHGNQTFRPGDLERGDEIDVRLDSSNNGRYVARDITVTRNVSDPNSGGLYGSSQTSTVRGTVRNIDTSRRTVELESATWAAGFNTGAGNSRTVVLQYDSNTRIDVNGSLQPLEGLERGDVVEVQVRNLGGSSYLIDRALLVRDVRR
ncbi:MAG TPA: DUF5666 domain-containing protein [Thermoanaerobaculia bacterium]|nr:DUF5666 domain-containing protein [Thermoanaerobaculia bacterium]